MAETLVFGANGFIGSHLVDKLAEDGHNVRAFDRHSSNRQVYNSHPNVEAFAGDYLNQSDLKDSLEDIDYVFHFISTTTPVTAENNPTIDIDTNIRMSVELMKLCVEKKVQRVIFASSGGAIYGENGAEGIARSETEPTMPVSPYAIGKQAIEGYLRYFFNKHGLESTALRISNPYGERQPTHRKQGVIPIFLDNIHNDRPITVYGDGSMVRDYIYVKDLAAMAAGMFDKDDIQSVYNLGAGRGNTINELIDTAKIVTGKDPVIETKETPSTFLKEVILDTTRYEADFGAFPLTGLEDGMRATYKHIQEQNS